MYSNQLGVCIALLGATPSKLYLQEHVVTRDEMRSPAPSPPTDGPPSSSSSLHDGRCVVICRLHWHVAGKAASSVQQADENIICLPMPQSEASHPHGGDGGDTLQQTGAGEPAGVVGITLRVAQVMHGQHVGTGEGDRLPTSRPASVGRSTAVAAATSQVRPVKPAQKLSAASADPARLRACCRHLRAVLPKDSQTDGGGVLLDTLDVALALRLGIRAPPALMGPVPPSSEAATPFHLSIEGQRTANGESLSDSSQVTHVRGKSDLAIYLGVPSSNKPPKIRHQVSLLTCPQAQTSFPCMVRVQVTCV